MKATIFILTMIFLIGCKKDAIENPDYYSDFLVYYHQSAGFVGWDYTLTIDSTGLIAVDEKRELPQELAFERSDNYELLALELDSINQDLRNLSRIQLQNYGFGPNKPTDLPVTFFKYKYGPIIDSSSIYHPDNNELPNELTTVLVRINRIRAKYDNR